MGLRVHMGPVYSARWLFYGRFSAIAAQGIMEEDASDTTATTVQSKKPFEKTFMDELKWTRKGERKVPCACDMLSPLGGCVR